MRPRAIIVVHRAPMVAESIAAALAQLQWLAPVEAVTTALDAERLAERCDGVVVDERLPGSDRLVHRLRRSGVRIVLLVEGRGHRNQDDPDDLDDSDEGMRVSTHASIASLASVLVPEITTARAAVSLTLRQEQVLSLVARGLATKQVARHLGISPKTVEHHKTRIFARLGVPNQAAAVGRFLARQGVPAHAGFAGSYGGFPPLVRHSRAG
jgi:DNA-binding CsgD family transcriptional regulator